MEITRYWAMPNSCTFSIKPIKNLIEKYTKTLLEDSISIDPFANGSKLAKITNDLDKSFDTTYHMDALEFMRLIKTNSVDFGLFDPPYSPRQVSESYKKFNMSVNMQTTQASFWGNLKKEFGRTVKVGGHVISFGWNSNGIGKVNGFEPVEILLVSHGGYHNDTICMVEKKIEEWQG